MKCKAPHWVIPSDEPLAKGKCKNCGRLSEREYDNRPRATDVRGVPIGWSMPYVLRQALNAVDAE